MVTCRVYTNGQRVCGKCSAWEVISKKCKWKPQWVATHAQLEWLFSKGQTNADRGAERTFSLLLECEQDSLYERIRRFFQQLQISPQDGPTMLCRYRPKSVKSAPCAYMVTAAPFRVASGPAKVPTHSVWMLWGLNGKYPSQVYGFEWELPSTGLSIWMGNTLHRFMDLDVVVVLFGGLCNF